MPLGKKVEIDEDLQNALRDIVSDFEKEDSEIRKNQIRLWTKLEEYWHGLQMIFWSERDRSWISPGSVHFEDVFDKDELAQMGPIYDYVVDIYKAHGESIIAALAANVPTLRYRPDDADNESDRMTARTYGKIADLVYVHNKAKLLFLQALYYLYNAGNVFSYRYTESDPKFGTFKIPKLVQQDNLVCHQCGNVREPNELEPCLQCGSDEPPTMQASMEQQGETVVPKSRTKIDVFGPLHVKVSYYAKNQAACGYLTLRTDQSKALVKSVYPKIEDDIEGERTESSDRFVQSFYSGLSNVEDTRMGLVTVEKTWLRPWVFWKIGSDQKEKRQALLAAFPNGCQITFIGKNRIFAEAIDESLDDRWEIGQSGISPLIHSDPLGKVLIGLQDMRNELVNLTMDTIDHGMPAVYADSELLDFDEYGHFESQPGVIYPAKARPGQTIQGSFGSEPKSSMSKEHMLFFRQIDQDAQFASGDFPAIHGGPSEGKSRTLGEYAMSKQMALQRLSVVWEFALDFWVRTVDGGVRMYADTVIGDQSYSKKENNDYINVWIRRTEMEGKVGGVEPEGGGNFPVSIVQKRSTLLELMQMQNPYVDSALYTPNNARLLKDTLAMEDLDLPGEDQRAKQARETNELIRPGAEPTPDGRGGFMPSVGIDLDVDDHEIHISVLRSFLVSIVGLDIKETNPPGYVNAIAHLKLHKVALMQQTINQSGATLPGEPPDTNAVEGE